MNRLWRPTSGGSKTNRRFIWCARQDLNPHPLGMGPNGNVTSVEEWVTGRIQPCTQIKSIFMIIIVIRYANVKISKITLFRYYFSSKPIWQPRSVIISFLVDYS